MPTRAELYAMYGGGEVSQPSAPKLTRAELDAMYSEPAQQEPATSAPATSALKPVQPTRSEHPARKYTGDGSPLSYVKQGVRSGLQGTTLGWSDEIGAGLGALGYKAGEAVGLLPESGQSIPELYSDMQKQSSDEQKQFNADYPAASIIGEVGGGLVPAIASGGGTMGAQTLGQIAKQGAMQGAGYGAVYGAGTADQGIGNRLEGGAIGGAVGAATGGVLAPALNVTGQVAGALRGAYQEAFTRTPEQKAQMLISSELAKTGYTPAEMARKVKGMGDKAILADANENALSILDQAVSKLGSTKDKARQFVSTRNATEQGDMLSLLSKLLSGHSYDDVRLALAKNATDMRVKAEPLYAKAFSSNVPKSEALDTLMALPDFKKAYKSAGTLAANDVTRVKKTVDPITGTKYGAGELTEAERLHYAKQALWDMEQAAGRGTNEAKHIAGMRRKLTDDVLDLLPDYKAARQTWSGGMGTEEAGDIGQQFFKLTGKPQEFIDMVSQLNPHDREVAKMALVNAATDKAGSKGSHLSSAGLLTENENKKRMLAALVGDDVAKEMETNAAKWKRFRRTGNALEGSRTGERMETGRAMDAANNLINPKGAMLEKLMSYVSPNGRRMADNEVATAIGNKLIDPNMTEQELVKLLTVAPTKAPYASKVTGIAALPSEQAVPSRMRE